MNFAVEILNDNQYPINADLLVSAASVVLSRHEVHTESGLSVVIVDDEYVRNLNRQFREVDSTTDVLSFPADPPPVLLEDEGPYLGDIIIAYPYASAQAARLGHPVEASLALLVVHGTLHLLGYDHDNATNRSEMWAAQSDALVALGVPVDIVPSLEEGSH